MLKLAEYLDTKYICEHHLVDVSSIKEDVDIADCRLTPKIEGWIGSHQQNGFTVVDSKSAARDNVLQINKRRYELAEERSTFVDIPELKSIEDLSHYFKDLDNKCVYQACGPNPQEIDTYLAILILIYRPDVQLDISLRLQPIMKIIHTALFKGDGLEGIKAFEDWYVSVQNRNDFSIARVTITTKDLQTPFELLHLGKVTWSKLLNSNYLIPAKIDKNNEFWINLSKDILKDICAYYKENNKKLEDFLADI